MEAALERITDGRMPRPSVVNQDKGASTECYSKCLLTEDLGSYFNNVGNVASNSRNYSAHGVRSKIDTFLDSLDEIGVKTPVKEMEEVICLDHSQECLLSHGDQIAMEERKTGVEMNENLMHVSEKTASTSSRLDTVVGEIRGLYVRFEKERQENQNNIQKLVEIVKKERDENRALNNKIVILQEKLEKLKENYISVVSDTATDLRDYCENVISACSRAFNDRLAKIEVDYEERICRLERAAVGNEKSDRATGMQVIREAPSLTMFSGKKCNGKVVNRWLRKAEECVTALGLEGVTAVQYIKNSLEDPALTRIRLARPKDLNEVRDVLIDAYGEKLSVTELKYELWSRKQANSEDVWEYADAITELDEELQLKENRSPGERENVKCTVFAKGLRNGEMGLKVGNKIDKGDVKSLNEAVKFVRERSRENVTVSKIRYHSQSVVKCWHCGEMGHVASHCKESWKGYFKEDRGISVGERHMKENEIHQGYVYNSKGNQAVSKEYEKNSIRGHCWNCRQIGHPMSQCPFQYKRDEDSKRDNFQQDRDNVVRRVDDECIDQGNFNCRTLEETSGVN